MDKQFKEWFCNSDLYGKVAVWGAEAVWNYKKEEYDRLKGRA